MWKKRDLYKFSPVKDSLEKAIRNHDLGRVTELLSWHVDINFTHGPMDEQLLLIAAETGNKDICKCLLDHGADVNVTCHGENALHYAARGGFVDCVQLLLKAGAKGNLMGSFGTPLLQAVRSGSVETVRFLLSSMLPGESGDLLHHAGQHFNIMKILLENDCDPNAACRLKVYGNEGRQPLHGAVSLMDQEEGIKLLLEAGADVNAMDNDGNTPLSMTSEHGYKTSMKTLLAHGANPNICDNTSTYPVHKAAENGHRDCLKQLLEAGAEIDQTDNPQQTPFLRAFWSDNLLLHIYNTPTCHLLLQEGCSLNFVHTMLNTTNGFFELYLIKERPYLQKLIMVLLGPADCSRRVFPYQTASVTDSECEHFEKWFLAYGSSCGSLQHICRLAIRRFLQPGPISLKLQRLGLPQLMQDYLYLKDLTPDSDTLRWQ